MDIKGDKEMLEIIGFIMLFIIGAFLIFYSFIFFIFGGLIGDNIGGRPATPQEIGFMLTVIILTIFYSCWLYTICPFTINLK